MKFVAAQTRSSQFVKRVELLLAPKQALNHGR